MNSKSRLQDSLHKVKDNFEKIMQDPKSQHLKNKVKKVVKTVKREAYTALENDKYGVIKNIKHKKRDIEKYLKTNFPYEVAVAKEFVKKQRHEFEKLQWQLKKKVTVRKRVKKAKARKPHFKPKYQPNEFLAKKIRELKSTDFRNKNPKKDFVYVSKKYHTKNSKSA